MGRINFDLRYMKQFMTLQKSVQTKTLDMVQKFMDDPTRSGLNLEKLNGFPDNIRTMRVDQQYRAVLVASPNDSQYLLVWVDNHDEAMAWARNKRFEVNHETGALQFYSVEEATRAVPAHAPEDEEDKGVIGALRDRQLVRIGVPEPLLPAIRNIHTLDDLDAMKPHIPEEVWEALLNLLCGEDYDDIVRMVESRRDEAERAMNAARRERAARPVFGEGEVLRDALGAESTPAPQDAADEEDERWERALAHPDTRRHVRAIESTEEIAVMLDRPFEEWRLFLHPDQSSLVERTWNGPVRVLGGAGTGKTVVALHRARYLAERVFRDPDDRILFTTYTTNLAEEIARLLDELCTPEARKRIDVRNLHGWAADYLKRQGVPVRLLKDKSSTANTLWEEAMTVAGGDLPFSVEFVREEWAEVVQRHGLQTERAYLLKPREGRGQRLSRAQRRQLWAVMLHFRKAREAGGWMEASDLVQEATRLLEHTGGEPPYRAVVVDEVQDMDESDFRLIARVVGTRPEVDQPNAIFLVGDPHQRIYNRRVRLRACHINITGRGRKLRLNYRTTDRIRRWAIACLEGVTVDDLDGGNDNLKGYVSTRLGHDPVVRHFEREEQEIDWLANELRTLMDTHAIEPNDLCVCLRTNDNADHYARALAARGLPTTRLARESTGEDDGIRVATIHRIKGLEFRAVALAGLQGPLDHGKGGSDDPTSRKGREDRARSLVYVAATRARDHLRVSGWGADPSPLLTDPPP